MIFDPNSLLATVVNWCANIVHSVRAGACLPLAPEIAESAVYRGRDPDFERWLHNDPMVTGNPASRYGEDSPGYLTGNGLGSLEIGAADD